MLSKILNYMEKEDRVSYTLTHRTKRYYVCTEWDGYYNYVFFETKKEAINYACNDVLGFDRGLPLDGSLRFIEEYQGDLYHQQMIYDHDENNLMFKNMVNPPKTKNELRQMIIEGFPVNLPTNETVYVGNMFYFWKEKENDSIGLVVPYYQGLVLHEDKYTEHIYRL